MAIVSLSEACRLAKVSRTTLYRYVKKGVISEVLNHDGSKGIDTSELLRVFGSLHGETSVKQGVATGSETSSETLRVSNETNVSGENALLQERIRGLELLLSEKDARISELASMVRLLEDKSREGRAESPRAGDGDATVSGDPGQAPAVTVDMAALAQVVADELAFREEQKKQEAGKVSRRSWLWPFRKKAG